MASGSNDQLDQRLSTGQAGASPSGPRHDQGRRAERGGADRLSDCPHSRCPEIWSFCRDLKNRLGVYPTAVALRHSKPSYPCTKSTKGAVCCEFYPRSALAAGVGQQDCRVFEPPRKSHQGRFRKSPGAGRKPERAQEPATSKSAQWRNPIGRWPRPRSRRLHRRPGILARSPRRVPCRVCFRLPEAASPGPCPDH